jgi:membrane associated rhomboid family serine protease
VAGDPKNVITADIPARSRLEAMDWSLVLISQGIESIVHRSEDKAGWVVQVSSSQYEAAVETIRLYRAENRRWGLRREVFQPGLLFDWVSIVWSALLCAFYWLSESRGQMHSSGILDTVAIAHGQWWRLFTAIWLHADLAHLASNAMFGFLLLGFTMGRYGTGLGLLAAYFAGAGGNVLSWLCSAQPKLGLGASGMVMGCVGLLAIQSVSFLREHPGPARGLITGLAGGGFLFLLLGVTPGTDVVAHFGGFASGLLLGIILNHWLPKLRKPFANLLSALMFVVLVLLPWCIALTHS